MVFDSVILSMKLRDRRLLCFFGLALAVLALLPQTSILGNWGTHIVILVMFYSTLAGAWNLLGGYTGQFSVGHAAFFGIAGYTMFFGSHDIHIAAHEPFTTREQVIREEDDITSHSFIVEKMDRRLLVSDTDKGDEIKGRLVDLSDLLAAYERGVIKTAEAEA